MEEKRKWSRLNVEEKERTFISCTDSKNKGEILDMSAGGMKVTFSKPVELGAIISGEFKVPPRTGPFYMIGKVSRVTERKGAWEVGLEFEKVSTIPVNA